MTVIARSVADGKGRQLATTKEERNAKFIFAGFDTGANGVLNGVMGS